MVTVLSLASSGSKMRPPRTTSATSSSVPFNETESTRSAIKSIQVVAPGVLLSKTQVVVLRKVGPVPVRSKSTE